MRARTGDGVGHKEIQTDLLGFLSPFAAVWPRQVDEIAHQHRQLLDLIADGDDDPLALRFRKVRRVRKQLDIGAHAGEWSAQLVRCVRNKLALGLP
jgi:hypothetical protein